MVIYFTIKLKLINFDSFKLRALQEWYVQEENIEDVPLKHMHYIGQELNQNAVAIKASNAFSVTYSLIANVRVLFRNLMQHLNMV